MNCGCISLPYMDEWKEAGILKYPGKRAFTEQEIALNPAKADYAEMEAGPTMQEILAGKTSETVKNETLSAKIRRTLRKTERSFTPSTNEQSVVIGSNGDVLFSKEGGPEKIRFSLSELALMKDAIVTHTHPGIASFSRSDIGLAAVNELAEVRAVDDVFVYSMRPPKEGWNQDWFERSAIPSIHDAMRTTKGDFDDALDNGDITGKQYDDNYWDEVWRRVARTTGLRYRRKKRPT